MAFSLTIIDNFYSNPEEVRQFALEQDFEVDGNYPGHRTVPHLSESVKDYFAKHLSPVHGEIYWPDPEHVESYCGSYQYTTSRDRTWIHADGTTTWAGIIYLTPDAPLSGGTGLFRHKKTGLYGTPRLEDGRVNQPLLDVVYEDAQDYTKWEMTDRVANVFNRLVVYRGDYFHASLDYFGTNKENGRLFQTFFFNTEF
jgi:hypothetical protein